MSLPNCSSPLPLKKKKKKKEKQHVNLIAFFLGGGALFCFDFWNLETCWQLSTGVIWAFCPLWPFAYFCNRDQNMDSSLQYTPLSQNLTLLPAFINLKVIIPCIPYLLIILAMFSIFCSVALKYVTWRQLAWSWGALSLALCLRCPS